MSMTEHIAAYEAPRPSKVHGGHEGESFKGVVERLRVQRDELRAGKPGAGSDNGDSRKLKARIGELEAKLAEIGKTRNDVAKIAAIAPKPPEPAPKPRYTRPAGPLRIVSRLSPQAIATITTAPSLAGVRFWHDQMNGLVFDRGASVAFLGRMGMGPLALYNQSDKDLAVLVLWHAAFYFKEHSGETRLALAA